MSREGNQPSRRFQAAVAGAGTAISAELALHRNSTAQDVADQAELFRDRVDGLQVQDNPLAWVNMSVLAASSLLLARGIDPVPRVTCRDRNRIGLLTDLLGLRALGVESLMLGRGRRVGKQHPLHATTVFDMTGRELITMAAELGEEEGARPFFIGTGAKAHRVKPGWAAEALVARGEAGAQFVQTQLCFNTELLRHWLAAVVDARLTWRYSVIISLTVFPSAASARWVKTNMTDSKIPDALIKRLEAADDEAAEGIAICAETMREIAGMPGVSGLHLMSMGEPELLASAIDASGLRKA